MRPKVVPIFFIVENSKEQNNAVLEKVNSLMTYINKVLEGTFFKEYSGTKLGLASMVFSDEAHFLECNYKGLTTLGYFKWVRMDKTKKASNYNSMAMLLNRSLSSDRFLKGNISFYRPVIFFITTSHKNLNEYEGIKLLKKNGYFFKANKVLINLGSPSNLKEYKPLINNLGTLVNANDYRVTEIGNVIKNIVFDHVDYSEKYKIKKKEEPTVVEHACKAESPRPVKSKEDGSFEIHEKNNFNNDFYEDISFEEPLYERMVFNSSNYMLFATPETQRANPSRRVDYSLFSEQAIKRNSNFIIKFAMYVEEYRHIIDNIPSAYKSASIQSGSVGDLNEGVLITTRLTSPNIPELCSEDNFVWNGKYHVSNLIGFVKDDYDLENIVLNVAVIVNGLALSNVCTIIDLKNNRYGLQEFTRKDVKKMFFSYSSEDRDIVLKLTKSLDMMCSFGTQFFLDVLSLRSGDKWEPKLYEEIDTSDAFCLVWSRNAYKSKWVEKEWKYALKNKGLDVFKPINLDADNPSVAPIPKPLQSVHFYYFPLLLKSILE